MNVGADWSFMVHGLSKIWTHSEVNVDHHFTIMDYQISYAMKPKYVTAEICLTMKQTMHYNEYYKYVLIYSLC